MLTKVLRSVEGYTRAGYQKGQAAKGERYMRVLSSRAGLTLC